MRRRDFLTYAGASAVTLPTPAPVRAQIPSPGMKRLGVIFTLSADDPQTPLYMTAMRDALRMQGWVEGKNLAVEYRWGAVSAAASDALIREMSAIAPDVVLMVGGTAAGELAKIRPPRLPIVFALITDPVALGLAESYAHPGGNYTGFANPDPYGPKLVELLREVVPGLKRVGALYNPEGATGVWTESIAAGARSFGLEYQPIAVRSAMEVVSGVNALAAQPSTGLVVGGDTFVLANRTALMAEVVKQRLPVVTWHVLYAGEGAMLTLAANAVETFGRAADYAGRVLNGARPADLPIQSPSKFDLTVNLKTARTMGIAIPFTIMTRADQVIE